MYTLPPLDPGVEKEDDDEEKEDEKEDEKDDEKEDEEKIDIEFSKGSSSLMPRMVGTTLIGFSEVRIISPLSLVDEIFT